MHKSIDDVFEPDRLRSWLTAAFSEFGVSTIESLKDDHKVNLVALSVYERIPLFPFRAAIKATMGKDGFVAFVFRIRDRMLQSNSVDLAWLNVENLKTLLSNEKRKT